MAKSGTRFSHVSLLNSVVDSDWVDDHYDGILDTVITGGDLETEDGLTLQTELGVTIELETATKTSNEVYTIPFVGSEDLETEYDLLN